MSDTAQNIWAKMLCKEDSVMSNDGNSLSVGCARGEFIPRGKNWIPKEMGPGSCRNERDVLFLVAMDPLPRAQQRTLREKEDSR